MKAVSVSSVDGGFSTLVLLKDNNKVHKPVNSLGLKKGDDFAGFYKNNKGKYEFRRVENFFIRRTKGEYLDIFKTKNKSFNDLIEEFELELAK